MTMTSLRSLSNNRNLALGGNWAGPVNASTPLPTTLLVDYIRLTGTN